nr:MAG TPA: hypothetical protein [Caudoviricetes sp.]
MTFVSFPIAYSSRHVNHLSYVSYLTLLIPEDDTLDVAYPPTYYVTHTMFRLPETFPLPHPTHQSIFGTLVPCPTPQSMHNRFYVSYVIPRPALARRACDAGARKAAKRLSTPASFPYSRVSRET